MSLTSEGILYLSLGFRGSYTLQVLSLRYDQGQMQIVLYDGHIYIGARYSVPANDAPSINPLQIVRIRADFKFMHRPIQITEIVIIGEEDSILGQEMLSLEQYMERNNFSRRVNHFSRMIDKHRQCEEIQKSVNGSKKIKPNEEPELQQEQIKGNETILTLPLNQSKTKPDQIDLDIEEIQKDHQIYEKHLIKDDQKSRIQVTQPLLTKTKSRSFVSVESEQDYCQIVQIQNPTQKHPQSTIPVGKVFKPSLSLNQQSLTIKPTIPLVSKSSPALPQVYLFISDLYERISRFRVMCRVNYVHHFISQKGRKCIKMIIIDAKGNQMQGMIYEEGKDNKIERGRVYIFENGEINKDQYGNLVGVFAWRNINLQASVFLPSFHPDRIITLLKLNTLLQDKLYASAIKNTENSQKQKIKDKFLQGQITVVGVFSGLKGEPKIVSKGYRIVGSIVHLKAGVQIEFHLFIDQLSDIPAVCSVITLHNIRVITEGRLHTLQSTPRSYIITQSASTNPILASLSCSVQELSGATLTNLSAMPFTKRKIIQLGELMSSMEEGQECCSLISGHATAITQKREYEACAVCKKQSRREERVFTYCYHCRKITKFSKRYLFDCELSDNTSSLLCSLSSDQIQPFIKISVEEYTKMSLEDRTDYLQLCSYEEVVVQIRSERVIGGAKHFVVSIQNSSISNANKNIEEIKKLSIADRLRISQKQ